MSRSNAIRGAAVLIGALIAAQATAATPEEQTVCRYDSRPGSRILSHTCLTQAQWVEVDKRPASQFGPAASASLPTGSPQPGPAQNWGGFQRY